MKEKWIDWSPIDNYKDKTSSTSSVNYSQGKLEISLISISEPDAKELQINISFSSKVYSYKVTDESHTLDVLETIEEQYGFPHYIGKSFYKVLNSEYLDNVSKFLNKEKALNLTHFAFLTSDYFIYVISSEEPIIEVEILSKKINQ